MTVSSSFRKSAGEKKQIINLIKFNSCPNEFQSKFWCIKVGETRKVSKGPSSNFSIPVTSQSSFLDFSWNRIGGEGGAELEKRQGEQGNHSGPYALRGPLTAASSSILEPAPLDQRSSLSCPQPCPHLSVSSQGKMGEAELCLCTCITHPARAKANVQFAASKGVLAEGGDRREAVH